MRTRSYLGIVSPALLHLAIIGLAVVWILPILGLLVTSFRSPSDVAATGWWTVFGASQDLAQYTLKNYERVINLHNMGRSFLNSLIITIPSNIWSVSLGAFAAYAFAWMRFPGRRLLFILLVVLLGVPLQMTLIPILRVFSRLGLAGTFPGIWLAHTGYGLPFMIYVLHNFIGGLPRDIFDSASIDGASSFRIFVQLVLPLSIPAIASVSIFQFIWIWNDLLIALIYLGGAPQVTPLTVQLASLVSSQGFGWEAITAGASISVIAPLVAFFVLQPCFVRGMLAGAVKE